MSAKLHPVFAANVQRILDDTGMSRPALAKAVGVSQQKLSQILSGYPGCANPTLELLERFAVALDVNTHELLQPRRLARSA